MIQQELPGSLTKIFQVSELVQLTVNFVEFFRGSFEFKR